MYLIPCSLLIRTMIYGLPDLGVGLERLVQKQCQGQLLAGTHYRGCHDQDPVADASDGNGVYRLAVDTRSCRDVRSAAGGFPQAAVVDSTTVAEPVQVTVRDAAGRSLLIVAEIMDQMKRPSWLPHC